MPSLTGVNHKRGKSGQNEGMLQKTLEEIEDGTGVNSNYGADDAVGEMTISGNAEVDQTAFIEQEEEHMLGAAGRGVGDDGLSMNSTESLK